MFIDEILYKSWTCTRVKPKRIKIVKFVVNKLLQDKIDNIYCDNHTITQPLLALILKLSFLNIRLRPYHINFVIFVFYSFAVRDFFFGRNC